MHAHKGALQEARTPWCAGARDAIAPPHSPGAGWLESSHSRPGRSASSIILLPHTMPPILRTATARAWWPGAWLQTASCSQGRARFPHVACTSPPRPPAQRTPRAQCRRRLQRCSDAACPWAATARIHACHAHRPARAAARIQHALPERLKAGSQDWRKRHPSPQNLAVRMPRSLGSALTAPTHHDHLGNPHRLSRAFALRGPWGRTPAHPTSHAQGTALELHAKQPGGCDTLDPALMVPPAAPWPRERVTYPRHTLRVEHQAGGARSVCLHTASALPKSSHKF